MAERYKNNNVEMVLTCSENNQYRGEKVLTDHALVRIISGGLKVIFAERTYDFDAGDTLLFPRNQLCMMLKYAKGSDPYKSYVVILKEDELRGYYSKNNFTSKKLGSHGILALQRSPLLDSFFASVIPYLELENKLPEKLLSIKIIEAIEILRSLDHNVDSILSDFSVPGKINLSDYMEKNYMFNIPIEKFSSLTGRSLATFKRDFKKIFNTSPQKWLTEKRLELAHYMLSKDKKKPKDIYFETGFENLSHFSYAFKKHFGYPPSHIDQY